MRDLILERGKYEWSDQAQPETRESLSSKFKNRRLNADWIAPSIRILYLLHPSLRALILRIHTQIHAFVNFVLSLDSPIPYPNSAGMMGGGATWDPRATVLAKENVKDVLGKEGVDLIEWGTAIQTLGLDPGRPLLFETCFQSGR